MERLQQAVSGSKPLKTRLIDIWQRCKPKLQYVTSGDGAGWLPIRLWLHITLFIGLGVSAMFALWTIFQTVFSPSLDDQIKLEVFRLILYIIAGIGGVFALVIAYRRQGLNEAAEVRSERADAREDGKVFNERFKSAADQLSSEHAANRLAGVYAMAGLADDWDTGRQTCINVLCAYLRMPYDPPNASPTLDTDDAEDRKERKERRQEQQVRLTIVSVIGERLRAKPFEGKTWHGHDFDFTEAHFDGGKLEGIKVTSGSMVFHEATFSGGRVDFSVSEFNSEVSFNKAKFSGGHVIFQGVKFSSGWVDFSQAEFSGSQVDFAWSKFVGSQVDFLGATFIGGQVNFTEVEEWDSPPVFGDGSEPPQPGLLLPAPIPLADDEPDEP
jgi:uncharacterized protein YjbI with pentapeptide repeats